MNSRMVAYAALFTALPIAAPAAVISQTFTLNASNFTGVSPMAPPAPYMTLTGDFTVQYDRSVSYTGATSITAANFVFPFTGPLKFDYNAATGNVSIGAGPGDTTTIYAAYPDFDFNFNIYGGVSSSPLSISYTSGTNTGTSFYQSNTGSVGFGPTSPVAAGAVPEPASWAMMIGGFGLVGGALRRRSVRQQLRFT